uniref:Jumonji domain-containing protein 4 n=1 Tax=Panagrolaimus davidi TaxID=227884 RepID=A0A914PGY3_9BILA
MVSLWPRSQRKVPTFGNEITQLDFVRSLREPCILSKDFTTNFKADIFLSDYKNEHGISPVDYEKFLNVFDPNHEVSVEQIDPQSGQKVYRRMSLLDFVYLLQEGGDSQVYLKDWHAQKEFSLPSNIYHDHLPYFMKMDWINNEKWTESDENPMKGDYRFIYFGAPGSRTLLHEDVFRSFSWSYNVTGFKHWLILPMHRKGEFLQRYPEVDDFSTIPNVIEDFELIEAIQEPGEIMVMPPGYYHQVLNLTECLSINHNTINAFNIYAVYEELCERLKAVLKELDDQRELRTEDDFAETVELVLNSDYRITKRTMFQLAQFIQSDRSQKLKNDQIIDCDPPSDIEATNFWTFGDIRVVESILNCQCDCNDASRHLLSPNPCPTFIKQMNAIDYFFSQFIIRKIADSFEQ